MDEYLFEHKIESKPDFSFLTVNIPENQTLKVEASSMATMDTHIKMKTKFRGFPRFLTSESVLLMSLLRKVLLELFQLHLEHQNVQHIFLKVKLCFFKEALF